MAVSTSAGSFPWSVVFSGAPPAELVPWLVERVWPGRLPIKLSVDSRPRRVTPTWQTLLVPTKDRPDSGYVLFADEADDRQQLTVHPLRHGGPVYACFPFPRDLDAIVRFLEAAPFTVASFGSLHAWRRRRPSFSNHHLALGWGCAFKGAGHDRLVSRRWLEHAPWRVIRGKRDLSLVLFHPLEASAREADTMSWPGHRQMGIGEEGGFLHRGFLFSEAVKGLYDARRKRLEVIVTDAAPRPLALLELCVLRERGFIREGEPLASIAIVFLKPAVARAALPDLWRRELECWTIVDGARVRLDGVSLKARSARGASRSTRR